MKKLLLAFSVLLLTISGFAQAPNINYPEGGFYVIQRPITPLSPTNSGGAVPATVYGTVSAFAGSGLQGGNNGTGSAARFKSPSGAAFDKQGNLYVCEKLNFVVRKITPAGVVTNFSSGFYPYGIAINSNNEIFVSDYNDNKIYKIDAAGVRTLYAGTGDFGSINGPVATASFRTPAGITFDNKDNLYIAELGGNMVRKITPAGIVSTMGAAVFSSPNAVACDAAGNVYVADQGNNLIRKITPGGAISIFAGSTTAGAEDGTGTGARFNGPYGIATDKNGTVYVADSKNNVIRQISPAGVVTTLAGSGEFSMTNGVGRAASFLFPEGLVADNNGLIYVTDYATVRKVTVTGYTIDKALPTGLSFNNLTGVINGTPTAESPLQDYVVSAYNTGGGNSATISIGVRQPSTDFSLFSIIPGTGTLAPAFSKTTYKYVLNVPASTSSITITPTKSDENEVMRVNGVVTASGTPVTLPINLRGVTYTINITAEDGISTGTYEVYVQRGMPSVTAPNITYNNPQLLEVNKTMVPIMPTNTGGAVPANSFGEVTTFASGFTHPFAVATDPAGNVFVTDYDANDVKKITPAGVVTTLPAPTDGYTRPRGVSTDLQGNLYVSDSDHNIVRKITPNGIISDYVGEGTYGSDNGKAAEATFRIPAGTSFDALGNMYIADSDNSTIRKVTLNGDVTTYAGIVGANGSADGAGSSATFQRALGVAAQPDGTLYVADQNNNKIRKISPDGTVSTFAGSGAQGADNLTGTAATFANPQGVTVDEIGNVYVADSYNAMIRKITPAGAVSLLAGNGIFALVNGIGEAASFAVPTGVATDDYGHLYVADFENKVVRKVELTGYELNIPLPAGLTFDPKTGTISGRPTTVQPLTAYAVTAHNAGGSSRFVVRIAVVNITNEASLSGLKLNTGTLSPVFDKNTLSYSTIVGTTANVVRVTATAVDAGASIKVNGVTVVSNFASQPIPIAVGSNTINVVVTASNGTTTKTYTIQVDRGASSSSQLSALAISEGALSPVFAAGTNAYTASVPALTRAIKITPTASQGNAEIIVNGTTIASGETTAALPLAVGVNVFTIKVTSESGTSTRTYTVRVTRPAAAISTLDNLLPNTGALNPVFATGTAAYTLAVPAAASSIKFTPTATDDNATITVNGTAVASGALSQNIPLAIGTTNVNVNVTAENGTTTQTYNVAVTRPPSIDDNLSALVLSTGALSPVFDPAISNYGVSVANPVTSLTVTPTTSHPNAVVTVNGTSVVSGNASAAINLSVGINVINVKVTAEDGTTTKTYAITVTRELSTNADLTGLSLSAGTLNPVFGTSTTAYTASVSNTPGTIKVTAVTADAGAIIHLNGQTLVSGTASADIPLNVGANTLPVSVTAADGVTTKTYTITVTRAPSSDATLSALVPGTGALSPVFAAATGSYTLTVASSVTSIKFTPTATNAASTITVNGTTVASGAASQAIPLTIGAGNIVDVAVTAQDGTVKHYTITVTRAASTNNELATLTVSSGTLNPAFVSTTLAYTVTVPDAVSTFNITPTLADASSTVTVNGIAVASGSASQNIALTSGSGNVIDVAITAQDASVKHYTITVTRQLSANADLSSLTTSNSTLSPVFAPVTTAYAVTVPNAVSAITFTPTASGASATITVNGTAVTSGSASPSLPLTVGAGNIADIAVTAADGTVKHYTVTITRQGSSDASLATLTVSSGSLSPSFDAANTAYTLVVPNTVSSLTITPGVNQANAIITVNGSAVASGAASQAIPLTVGAGNNIDITITAQDGTIQHYTIAVTRQASANADLARISLGATLSPAFSPNVTSYTATVTDIVSMSVDPAAADAGATVRFNGTVVTSGNPGSASLALGNNPQTIEVTAADGVTKKVYSLNIIRLPATDANLSALTVSSGTLSPTFSPAIKTYTVAVANSVSAIKLTPTKAHVNASVTVNGAAAVSGTATPDIPLSVGPNAISVVVTAEDGTTTNTYTITVNRAASAVATLSNLALSSGTLNPSFVPATGNYSATVNAATSVITVTPTATDANAVIKVNGTVVATGTASANIPLTFGANSIGVVVTAQDGTTTKTYTIAVTRQASANANLSALVPGTGTLSPAFAAATTSYTIAVGNADNTIRLTPTAANTTATILVNGTAVASGTASNAIPLTVGSNNIAVKVTAQDGTTTKTYTVTVNRAQSANADLASLAISQGTLSPSFAASNSTYSAIVTNATASITLTPTVSDANATVKVNGTTVTSGTASPAIPLVVGPNVITLLVTAQNGATKTYTVTVTRDAPPASPDATLTALNLSAGGFTPAFSANTTSYSITVANTVTATTVTPVANDANAVIKVNNVVVTSGSSSAAINLAVGSNVISTVVTAQNGVGTTVYTVNVIRQASADATLSNIALSQGTLTPAFSAGTSAYTAFVGNAINSITLTPTVNSATASVKVNGNTVASGSASNPIALVVGANVITTNVTAQDGTTTKTYTITVTRAASSDANLANLTLSSGTLSPAFGSGVAVYSASVTNATSALTVTPTVNDAGATVTVNNAVVTSGTASASIPLTVGTNNIQVEVTAADGTTRGYLVTVTRPASTDANLTNLVLSAGTLSPGFTSSTTSYSETVANNVATIGVTAVASHPNATIKVNGIPVASGSASGNIALTVGSNTITTEVTAEDGNTIKTYTVTVNRLPSNDASLAGLSTSAGALSPAFASATTLYNVAVPNLTTTATIRATAAEANADITINGNAIASGTNTAALPLVVGVNTFTIRVTAQDGTTTKTYTLTINRAQSSDATLSNLAISSGTLAPAFAPATVGYAATVTNLTTFITLIPTASEANAVIKVNGAVVASGAATNAIPLIVGTNNIAVAVTAQDGTTLKTYTIAVTRLPSSDAALKTLTVSTGTLAPAFTPATTGYTVAVANAVTTISVTPTVNEVHATVKVNGTTLASGTASSNIPLTVGANNITLIVTAEDGTTTQSYTVRVNRAPSSNADLANLTVSAGTLTPSFGKAILGYTALVKNNISSITLQPTADDNTATIKINGVSVASGATSAAIPLAVGNTTINTVVTAQDGTTIRTYKIIINRALSSVDDLTDLKISAGTLSPAFESGTNDYTASVSNATTSLKVTPTVADPNATVTVNGTAVVSGAASGNVNLVVGANTIKVVVTAQDHTINTYTVVVTRVAPANSTLAGLSLSTATITPAFAPGTAAYTATVANSVLVTSVTPIATDPAATITVNGITVASGTASADIPLNQGNNLITVVVTGKDGINKNTYTISVTRQAPPQSNDASLANLALSTGNLIPGFSPATQSYSASVANTVTGIAITPTANSNTSTIKVEGVTVASGFASGNTALNVGTNVITTVVTAQDGTTQTYSVTVTRQAAPLSSNANLSALSVSNGTLSPVFDQAVTTYTTQVPNATSSVNLTATVANAAATIKVNGATAASGVATGPYPLTVGSNTLTVDVTAQDGTVKTYTVNVIRAVSSDATLSNIFTTRGDLSPSFSPSVFAYTANIGSGVPTFIILPTATDPNASIEMNGTSYQSGQQITVAPVVGLNIYDFKVTAQDGSVNHYILTMTKSGAVQSSNALLAGLVTSEGPVTPAFNPSQQQSTYSIQVANNVTTIKVTTTLQDTKATLYINGVITPSGAPSAAIPLVGNKTYIDIRVVAEDGGLRNTTLDVNRIAPVKSSDATLANLAISQGTLTPAFTPATTTYSATVGNLVNTVNIVPTVNQPNATIQLNGTTVASGSSTAVNLNVGTNNFNVKVTAEDGTVNTYNLAVTRGAPLQSANADLSDLTVSSGTLNPAFAPATIAYTVSLPNTIDRVSVTPTVADPAATVTVNGTAVTSGTASAQIPVNVGTTSILVRVTAQNGSSKTYTITVNRGAPTLSADATLTTIMPSAGTLSPAFTSANGNYTLSVANSVTNITLKPNTTNGNAIVALDGVVVPPGQTSQPIALTVGTKTVNFTVTAQDGVSTKTYTVVITREAPAASANANLSNLLTNRGLLNPMFSPTTTTYQLQVDYDATTITFTPTIAVTGATIKVDGQTVLNGAESQTINLPVGETDVDIIVTAPNGNTVKIYTVTITRNVSVAKMPTVFTPNADGVNDFWMIPNIELHPQCTVKVFNRGGVLVFSSVGYGTPWDGTLNGKVLPPDVYFYIIDLKDGKKPLSGSITIIR